MDLAELNAYMIHIGEGKKLSGADKKTIKAELPGLIEKIQVRAVPDKISLPSGDKIGSASRITALKCHAILLARKAFGKNYIKEDPAFESLAQDILFFVMRGHFNGGGVKGEFCCPSCTLSLLPLYETDCFKWVSCGELAENVKKSLKNKRSIFSGKYSEKYMLWASSIK